MTPQELKDIEARANEATEGPWGQHDYDTDHCMITAGVDGNGAYIYVADVWDERDIPFIAHARQDIQNLLAYIAALRAELERKDAALKFACAFVSGYKMGSEEVPTEDWRRPPTQGAAMSDSIIEQVKRLAEAQKAIPEGAQLEGTMYGAVDAAYFVQQASALDFPALLAHIATQAEALKVAVGALAWYEDNVGMCARFDAVPGGTEARAALAKDIGRRANTALSRIAALTGEKK